MSYTKPGTPSTPVTLVEGDGIDIDNTIPSSPVISVDESELDIPPSITLVAGTGIAIDNTTPEAPVISSTSAGLESIQPGTNVSIDATDELNPIINSVGGSGSAVIVDTIGAMEGYVGSEQVIFVKDRFRGGTFTKVASGLTVNNGTIFSATGGGFWLRQFDEAQGVNVKWFGATGDYAQDCTDIFRAAIAYCLDYFVFEGGTPPPPFIRRKLIIPNGDYRWTSQVKVGGRPISEADSLIYQYTNNGVPSYNLEELKLVANTIGFSIEGGDRTHIHGDWEPTELEAIFIYGCNGYQTGFQQINPGVTISNLIFVGNPGMANTVITEGTNQMGFAAFGTGNIKLYNLSYINLQVGESLNTCYSANRTGGTYQNCGQGFANIGSHSMTGGNLWADHCGLGYHFDGGAAVWNQINTEQCRRAALVTGGNVTINGVYLEQLDNSSGSSDYQLEIASTGIGFMLNGGTISPYNGKSILVSGEGNYVGFKNVNGGGAALDVVHASTSIYIENCAVNYNNIGNFLRPLSNGFGVTSAYIGILNTAAVTTGTVTASGALSGASITTEGDVALPVGGFVGTITEINRKKPINLLEEPDIILILGRTNSALKGDSVIGRITVLGNMNPALVRGGFIDINFSNKHTFSDYVFGTISNLATGNVTAQNVTFTIGGIEYVGIRFYGPTGAWNYARVYFEGVYGGEENVLTSISTSSVGALAQAFGVRTETNITAEVVKINGVIQ